MGCDHLQQEPGRSAGCGRGKGVSLTLVPQVREKGWASDEHLTEDGTVIEAWASRKSFQLKEQSKGVPSDHPGNPDGELPMGRSAVIRGNTYLLSNVQTR